MSLGNGRFYFCFLAFPHRVCAAFRAISVRRSGLTAFARAFAPLRAMAAANSEYSFLVNLRIMRAVSQEQMPHGKHKV